MGGEFWCAAGACGWAVWDGNWRPTLFSLSGSELSLDPHRFQQHHLKTIHAGAGVPT